MSSTDTMKWNDLSMTDRARFIRMGIESGILDLDTIHNIYNTFITNKYAGGGPVEALSNLQPQETVPPAVRISQAIAASESTSSAYDYYDEHMYDDPSLYDSQGTRDIAEILQTGLEYTPIAGTILDGIELINNPSAINAAAFGVGTAFDAVTLGLAGPITKAFVKGATRVAPRAVNAVRRASASRVARRAASGSRGTTRPSKLQKLTEKYGPHILDFEQSIMFNELQKREKEERDLQRLRERKKQGNRITAVQDNTRIVK